jgi:hypothetical protein
MSASPALAVDREMVGRDNEAALGDGLFRRYCCCFSAAASKAAWAVCCSRLLGEEEKKLDNLAALENEVLREACLSLDGMATGAVLLAKGF